MNPRIVDAKVAPMTKSVDPAIEKRWCCGRLCSGTTRRCCLMGAFLAQHRRDRARDQREIGERAPTIDVAIVELHPLVEVDVASSIDLPQTRDSLRYGEAAECKSVVVLDLTRKRRARADQGHIAG